MEPSEEYHPNRTLKGDSLEPNAEKPFYIVGVGASAGGLEALERFFSGLPKENGMAFVVIQHLSPTHKSHMVDLLSKHTSIPVQITVHDTQVEPNHIYLIPPSKNITYDGGFLKLSDQDRQHMPNYPIDLFLESLARGVQMKAIGVILSGTGSDGTKGLRLIKEHGGLALVQQPDTAQFDGMPNSAIGSVLVDQILAPQDMAAVLMGYVSHPKLSSFESSDEQPAESDDYSHILELVKTFSGVDFRLYKQSTISRRIEHRMGITQAETLQEYRRLLQASAEETKVLFRELLIGVTRFFRNQEAFDKIEHEIIPMLFRKAKLKPVPAIRVWVPACSTGEEAYSLAMLLYEQQKREKEPIDIKVFATDIDPVSISKASLGLFTGSIVSDVSPVRMQRFFMTQGDQYQIARELRQMIIFAPHNVTRDIPFSKVDLITCRNLLIYLNPHTQVRVLINFAYALNKGGILFMGRSEHITGCEQYFSPLDAKNRIYTSKGEPPKIAPEMMFKGKLRRSNELMREARVSIQGNDTGMTNYFLELLATYMPPSVVVNKDQQVIYFFGDTNPFIRFPAGLADMSITKIIHEDLRLIVGTALHKVFKDGESSIYHRISLSTRQNEQMMLDLQVEPIRMGGDVDNIIVVFRTVQHPVGDQVIPVSYDIEEQTRVRIEDLERRLQYSNENLQAAIEELETSNEELQATNQELMAANEELQSTNEELQSTNEELSTVNAEFQEKIQELTELTSDMENLLESTQICTIFLDDKLCIRKFTEPVIPHIALQSSDLGRPIYHFTHDFIDVDLKALSLQVLISGKTSEFNIQNKKDQWFLLKITPYQTFDDMPTGVVLTIVDITDIQKTRGILELNEVLQKEIVDRKNSQQMLEDLIYLTSHEMKSPLRAFRFLADNVKEDVEGKLSEEASQDLDELFSRIDRMELIVEALLKYSRFGRFEEKTSKIAVPDLMSHIEEQLEVPSGFEVKYDYEEVDHIETNQNHLEQVLTILIENALKHHDKETGTVSVAVTERNDATQFVVSDDGPGISSADREKIFQLFHPEKPRAEQSRFGMGLAFAKKSIESRGGRLELESDLGAGAKFTFLWPNKSASAASSALQLSSKEETEPSA